MPEHEFFIQPSSPEKKPKQIQMGKATQSKGPCPENNQDYSFFDPIHQSFGVFDGVGGVPNGRLAAQKCSESIEQSFSEMFYYLSNLNPEGIDEAIQNISTRANLAITEGFTTGVFGFIVTNPDGTRRAYVGCVGDSRVYSIHRNNLHKETHDQNYISHPDQDILDKLKGKKYARYKKSIIGNDDIFQIFGKPNVIPVITKVDLEPRDTLLVLSDGIFKSLDDNKISSTCRKYRQENPEIISQKLVDLAHDRSQKKHPRSTPDDMTAVVIKIP